MHAATVTTVPTRDGRLVTVRRWAGTGRPLVLLHGLLDSSEGWAWLAERSPRPCVAIDLPGFGGSDRARHPRIAAFADDVSDALDALEIARCSLIGHSLGGAVAAEVAERSDRVDHGAAALEAVVRGLSAGARAASAGPRAPRARGRRPRGTSSP